MQIRLLIKSEPRLPLIYSNYEWRVGALYQTLSERLRLIFQKCKIYSKIHRERQQTSRLLGIELPEYTVIYTFIHSFT